MVKEYVSVLSKVSVSVLMFLTFLFILKISYIYIYEKKKSTAATVKKLVHFFVMIYIVLIMILNYIQFDIYYYNPAVWTIFYKVTYNICGFLFTSSFILLLTYWIGMITDIFEIRKGAIFTKFTGPIFMVVQFTNFVIKLLTIISNARLFYLQTRLDLEKASIYYDFFVNTFVLIILVVFIVVNLYIFNKKVRRRIKIFTVIASIVGITFFVLTLVRVLIYYDNDKYSYATLILVSALCLEVIFVIYPIRIDVIKNQHINKFLGLFYIGYSKETKQETQSSYKKSHAHLHHNNNGGATSTHMTTNHTYRDPSNTVALDDIDVSIPNNDVNNNTIQQIPPSGADIVGKDEESGDSHQVEINLPPPPTDIELQQYSCDVPPNDINV